MKWQVIKCFLLLLYISQNIQAQERYNLSNKQFYIFVKSGGYSDKVSKLVDQSNNMRYYKFMGNYYIDRDRQNIINYKYVDEGLKKLFPKKDAQGFLCLNLENKYYKDIKSLPAGHKQVQEGLRAFIELVKYIKLSRPNVKIGIYGMPYAFYWNNQKVKTSKIVLDSIFKHVDYISPALYIFYPDKQLGANANINYLKENLQVALQIGIRLNKPVIPYVWYVVHPNNQRHGSELISSSKMSAYLKLIRDFNIKGTNARGVIWWEPANTTFKMPHEDSGQKRSGLTKEDILIESVKEIVN